MLHTILTIIGFVLVSVFVVLLIRFVLFLQKVFTNINSNINEITNEIKAVRRDVSDALSGVDKLLLNASDTIERTNEMVTHMKIVVDAISTPISGVQRYTSAVGKFMKTFKEKIRSNEKRLE